MTQKSPWAWQSPPLPSTFSVVSQSLDTPHERIWYRKLWGLEASMAVCTYTLPGMADIIISCHLRPPSGSLVPIEEALVKSAVRALRFEQPIIATKLAFTDVEPGDFPRPEEGRFVYEVPASEEDVDRWLNEVVTIHTDVSRSYTDIDSAVTAVTRDLSSVGSAPPTTLFELHFVPSVGEDRTCVVILRMGHALFDGIGCWLFLDAFNAKLAWMLGDPLRAQQKLLWGEEVSRLTGAVPDRLKVPWAPDKIEDDQVMVEKLREAATLPKTVPGLNIPHPIGPASKTGIFLRVLPPRTVKQLTAYARAHNCTLFSMFIAATVLALLRLHPPTDTTKDIDIAMYPNAVNLRGTNLRDGENQRAVAMTVGFHAYVARELGRFVRTQEGQKDDDALWTLAREIRSQVDDQLKYMDRAAFWGHEMLEILGHFAAGAKKRDKPPRERAENLPTLPSISSLGVMDRYLAPFHVIRPPGTTVSETDGDALKLTVSQVRLSMRMPYNPSVLVHPYTWQGTCYVSASFAEGYLGSLSEQEAWLAKMSDSEDEGEKARLKDEERAPVVTFMNEFMKLLEDAAATMETPAVEARPAVEERLAPKTPTVASHRDVSQLLVRLRKAWRRLKPQSI